MAKHKKTINRLLGKSKEPEPCTSIPTQGQLAKYLNWYNVNVDNSKLKSYLITYSNQYGYDLNHLSDHEAATMGSIARMLMLNFTLSSNTVKRLNVFCETHNKVKQNTKQKEIKKEKPKNPPKYDALIGNFEHALDNYIVSGDDNYKLPIKTSDINKLVSHINKMLLLLKDDYDIDKSYTSKDYKLIKKYLDNTLKKLSNIKNNTSNRKTISRNKSSIVKKVKCNVTKQSFTTKVILPIDIIGKKKMYVYDIKARKLKLFVSVGEGFTFSGTSLKNYDVEKSIEKSHSNTDNFDMCTKISVLNKVMSNSKRVGRSPSGRFNDNMVILAIA